MTDQEIRLECIRIAQVFCTHGSLNDILSEADTLYRFTQGRWEQQPKAKRD